MLWYFEEPDDTEGHKVAEPRPLPFWARFKEPQPRDSKGRLLPRSGLTLPVKSRTIPT